MRRLLPLLAFAMISPALWAQPIQPEIELNSIKVVKTTEYGGDELYLVVTEFAGDGSSKQYTIPDYPVTWPSEKIGQIKDIKLWQGDLPSGTEKDIIIELVEHDAPPYNVDDSIGSVRIKMTNADGKLKTAWIQDWSENGKHKTHKELHEEKNVTQSYTFTGDEGEYKVKISLKKEAGQNHS